MENRFHRGTLLTYRLKGERVVHSERHEDAGAVTDKARLLHALVDYLVMQPIWQS